MSHTLTFLLELLEFGDNRVNRFQAGIPFL